MAKILIVDDDPDVVDACRMFLERERHEVDAAYSRAEGMNAVREHAPDLIILDVIMEQPDDGIAMAQQLRREGFNKPILMLTSIGKVTGLSYGKHEDLLPVDAFIDKPVEPATLVTTVAALLRGKEG
jgi:DNA-binding response OmpR family regulator